MPGFYTLSMQERCLIIKMKIANWKKETVYERWWAPQKLGWPLEEKIGPVMAVD